MANVTEQNKLNVNINDIYEFPQIINASGQTEYYKNALIVVQKQNKM